MTGRIEAIIHAHAPDLPTPDRARVAQVCLHLFRALSPQIVNAPQPERTQLVAELKKVLCGYLAPVIVP